MDTGANLLETADKLDNGRAGKRRNARSKSERTPNNKPKRNVGKVDEAATSDDPGMEVADGANRAPECPWDRTASITLRIMRAQGDAQTLEKDADIKGKNKETIYRGITSDQIVTNAKRVLHKHGILYQPTIDKEAVRVNGNVTAVFMQGHFINADQPDDVLIVTAWGSDADNAGKGYMKATTNANKNVLAKALMMSTIEDEQTEQTEARDTVQTSAQLENEALTESAIKAWADAYRDALGGCQNLKDLKRIRAENAHMMRNPRLPRVTREYFEERIIELESTLT